VEIPGTILADLTDSSFFKRSANFEVSELSARYWIAVSKVASPVGETK
jgi:hypothetical protein